MEYLEPIRAHDLRRHAETDAGASFVHELVGQLLRADGSEVEGFAPREGLRRRGWDGKTFHARGTRFVPRGRAYWELTSQNGRISEKATRDFLKRPTGDIPGAVQASYVAVSLHPWPGKLDWLEEQAGSGWGGVHALDADDLVAWLEAHPTVHQWATRRVRGFLGGVAHTRAMELPALHPSYVVRPQVARVLAEVGRGPGAVRMVVLWGGPGMGKTTAAVSLAHELAASFPDGQFFQAFARTAQSAGRVADLRQRISEALDGERHADGWREDLAQSARGRRILILLDDVLDESAVRELGEVPEGVMVIVTARSRLSGLLDVERREVGTFTLGQGVELFRSSLSPEMRVPSDHLSRMFDLCDGVPLALRIAATQLALRPEWESADFVAELEDERTRLDALEVGDQAVRSSFEISFRALLADHQRAFCAVSMLPGRLFDAKLLAAASETSVAGATKALRGLQEAALISPTRVSGFFDMHDLLRLFSRELAEQLEGSMSLQGRSINWLLAESQEMVRAWVRPGGGGERRNQMAMVWFQRYTPNLLDAIELAGTVLRSPAAALGGVDGVAVYLTRQERWVELEALCRLGQGFVRRLRELPDASLTAEQLDLTQAVLLSRRAEAAVGLEDGARALRFAQAAQGAAERIPGYEWESHGWVITGHAFGQLGDWESALLSYRRASAIAGLRNDEANRVLAGYNMGRTLHRLGRDSEALPYLLEELDAMVASGDRHGAAITRNTLALTLRRLGDPERAEKMLTESVNELRNSDDLRNLSHALFDLGVSLMGRGEYAAARARFEEELAVLEAVEDPREHARTRLYLSRLDLLEERDVDGHILLHEIDRCLDELPAPDAWRAEALLIRGSIRLRLTPPQPALDDVAESLAIIASLQDLSMRTPLLHLAGSLLDGQVASPRRDALRAELERHSAAAPPPLSSAGAPPTGRSRR